MDRRARGPGLPARAGRSLLNDYVGQAVAALYLARTALGSPSVTAIYAQARGPQPHGRAQDQQRDRPAPLAQRMGKTPRSSPRPGAGSHGVAGSRPPRALLGLECIVHGHRGHAPPGVPTSSCMELLGTTRRRRSRPGAADAEGEAVTRRRSATGSPTTSRRRTTSIGSCVGPGAVSRRSCATCRR